jgi:hypothetical protein
MPKAFKATIYRLVVFFIGSALAIGGSLSSAPSRTPKLTFFLLSGILVPYNDPNLLGAQASDAPGGAKSPYVISMQRLAIPVLPDIVNALVRSLVAPSSLQLFSTLTNHLHYRSSLPSSRLETLSSSAPPAPSPRWVAMDRLPRPSRSVTGELTLGSMLLEHESSRATSCHPSPLLPLPTFPTLPFPYFLPSP